MTEHAGGRSVAVEIDAFNQQVSCDHEIAIGYLLHYRTIIADSHQQASGMLARSCLFTKTANEVEFVHEFGSEFSLQAARS